MDIGPTVGTWVMIFTWFVGSPSEKTVVDTEEMYSERACDERAELEIHKFRRRDLGIVCQFIPGIAI